MEDRRDQGTGHASAMARSRHGCVLVSQPSTPGGFGVKGARIRYVTFLTLDRFLILWRVANCKEHVERPVTTLSKRRPSVAPLPITAQHTTPLFPSKQPSKHPHTQVTRSP